MLATPTAPHAPSAALLSKYSRPGPRYTSYPAVPHWPTGYGAAQWDDALAGLGADGQPISLYVHVPFCEQRCLFCACNVVLSRVHTRGSAYVDHVRRELDRTLAKTGGVRPEVVQMHWGGGTPTWLDIADLRALFRAIDERVALLPDREQSIEVDPRVTTMAQLETLVSLGLDRLSMGVQDIDGDVQRAIGRHQSVAQIESMVLGARSLGVRSISVDLVYGLPHQSIESFQRTVQTVASLGVDRVAVYNFAYLPERVKHQRAIRPATLPDAELRVELFRVAARTLTRAGYDAIGMDHFALQEDELTRARNDGTLRRNFMGYTTRAGTDLLALGVSAISRVGRDFGQVTKELPAYMQATGEGRSPIVHGMRLGDDDLLRERIIHDLMCYGEVELAGATSLLASARTRDELDGLELDGIITRTGTRLRVTPRGRYFVRNVAMAFDAYLDVPSPGAAQPSFSRTA
ncbi:MAG: oxygen-independent coproporphyrinogen III oxidase [Deltaproteobacteria bacterium]|nr:oxygen-independent coproporphyrinogen III oxidase [Deltaproteobacteria bacterium]